MDITFCTFYFDIDRGNWDTFTVANNTYLYWFKNVLALDVKLHIATEEKFVEEIKKARSKIDPNFQKTIIQVTTIQELEGFKKFNSSLEKLMFSSEFKEILCHPKTPEMSKPLYNVLMFHKVNYLNEVAKKNPFNTEYFSWVDAGFIRSERDIEGITSWPDPEKLKLTPDKIKFFCINDDIKGSVRSIKDHLLSQVRLLKGTIFFLHKDLTAIIRDKFNRHVDQSIENGYIGSDEKIFDLCCLNDPELFDLYKCNWREELKLFSYEHSKLEPIIYNITCEWESDDIEKCEDYDFWFFGVEDEHGKLIVRDDFSYGGHDAFLNFNQTNKSLKFSSTRCPENFIIWPHSQSRGYLKALKKKVKFTSEEARIRIDYRENKHVDKLEKNELTLVVARYGEDTSWTAKIKHRTIIFNKNENDYESFEENLPNVGREGHTHFNYIVENYDSLTSHIAFTQGNPFDHCADAVGVINNFDFNKDFLPIGPSHEQSTMHEGINNQIIKFSRDIGFNITFPVYCVRGAQYIISRKLIWKKPKEFYQKILDTLKYEKYPQAGLDVEKTLFQIYGLYKIEN
jgi:hypothetical protein